MVKIQVKDPGVDRNDWASKRLQSIWRDSHNVKKPNNDVRRNPKNYDEDKKTTSY